MWRFLRPVLLLFPFFLSGQQQSIVKNLVPNGSFENFRKPSSDVRKAIPWQQIESVDYYQRALDNDTTAERGGFDGTCYTGMRFRKKYKEFLQVKLAESLHRDVIYEVSFQIRLAFWSNMCLRSFGLVFTKAGYRGPQNALKAYMVDSVSDHGLHNHYKWIEVNGFYKAAGGEKFITIGNFEPVIKRDMMPLNLFRLGAREAYYFVDDIRITKASQFEDKVAVQRIGPDYMEYWMDSSLKIKPDVQIGEKISLPNITFEEEKYYLKAESYNTLNRLAAYLIKNPGVQIQINGHSNDARLEFRNQRMSELRAREVFEYLIRRGVQNKMYFKGFGSSSPLSEDDSDAAKAKNRRVEFEIISK